MVGIQLSGRSTRSGARVAAGIAAGVCALLGLAACGGSDGDEEASEPGLEEAFGLPAFDEDGANEEFEDEQRRLEEAIAACMADRGFEYEPYVPDFGGIEFTEEDQVEYARRNGFSVTLPYGDPEYDGDAGGFVEDDDPNSDYVSGLSESEMTAYYEALDGTPEEMAEYETTETDPETGETYTMIEGAGAGCRGDAQREVTGDRDTAYSAMEPLYEEIYERVEADPRTAELEAEWSSCMTDAGFDFATPDEVYDYAYEDLAAELADILGFNPMTDDPFENLSAEEQEALFEGTDEEINARFEELEEQRRQVPDGVDREALQALHEKERSLAVAEVECSAGLYEEQAEVYREIEAEFVRDNADRIAELAGEAGR